MILNADKFTQVKINMYLEEISDKSSQIETLKGLEKINKKLSTQISELKVKKGKSVAVQTDLVRLHKYVIIHAYVLQVRNVVKI